MVLYCGWIGYVSPGASRHRAPCGADIEHLVLITSTQADGDDGNDNDNNGDEDINDDKYNDSDDVNHNDDSNDCNHPLIISSHRRYDRIASVADLILVSLLDSNCQYFVMMMM